MPELKPYIIIFRANGQNQERIEFYENITQAVDDTRKAIKAEFGDHKIQQVVELSGEEFQELTQK